MKSKIKFIIFFSSTSVLYLMLLQLSYVSLCDPIKGAFIISFGKHVADWDQKFLLRVVQIQEILTEIFIHFLLTGVSYNLHVLYEQRMFKHLTSPLRFIGFHWNVAS